MIRTNFNRQVLYPSIIHIQNKKQCLSLQMSQCERKKLKSNMEIIEIKNKLNSVQYEIFIRCNYSADNLNKKSSLQSTKITNNNLLQKIMKLRMKKDEDQFKVKEDKKLKHMKKQIKKKKLYLIPSSENQLQAYSNQSDNLYILRDPENQVNFVEFVKWIDQNFQKINRSHTTLEDKCNRKETIINYSLNQIFKKLVSQNQKQLINKLIKINNSHYKQVQKYLLKKINCLIQESNIHLNQTQNKYQIQIQSHLEKENLYLKKINQYQSQINFNKIGIKLMRYQNKIFKKENNKLNYLYKLLKYRYKCCQEQNIAIIKSINSEVSWIKKRKQELNQFCKRTYISKKKQKLNQKKYLYLEQLKSSLNMIFDQVKREFDIQKQQQDMNQNKNYKLQQDYLCINPYKQKYLEYLIQNQSKIRQKIKLKQQSFEDIQLQESDLKIQTIKESIKMDKFCYQKSIYLKEQNISQPSQKNSKLIGYIDPYISQSQLSSSIRINKQQESKILWYLEPSDHQIAISQLNNNVSNIKINQHSFQSSVQQLYIIQEIGNKNTLKKGLIRIKQKEKQKVLKKKMTFYNFYQKLPFIYPSFLELTRFIQVVSQSRYNQQDISEMMFYGKLKEIIEYFQLKRNNFNVKNIFNQLVYFSIPNILYIIYQKYTQEQFVLMMNFYYKNKKPLIAALIFQPQEYSIFFLAYLQLYYMKQICMRKHKDNLLQQLMPQKIQIIKEQIETGKYLQDIFFQLKSYIQIRLNNQNNNILFSQYPITIDQFIKFIKKLRMKKQHSITLIQYILIKRNFINFCDIENQNEKFMSRKRYKQFVMIFNKLRRDNLIDYLRQRLQGVPDFFKQNDRNSQQKFQQLMQNQQVNRKILKLNKFQEYVEKNFLSEILIQIEQVSFLILTVNIFNSQ